MAVGVSIRNNHTLSAIIGLIFGIVTGIAANAGSICFVIIVTVLINALAFTECIYKHSIHAFCAFATIPIDLDAIIILIGNAPLYAIDCSIRIIEFDFLIAKVAFYALPIFVVFLARRADEVIISNNSLINIQKASSVLVQLVAIIASQAETRISIVCLTQRRNRRAYKLKIKVISLNTDFTYAKNLLLAVRILRLENALSKTIKCV